jgi:signal transduction histidine kinase
MPSSPRDFIVRCDAQLVERAVSNLIANAIRHSGSKDIAVSIESVGHESRIAVEDHGIGVPPEHAERIFERFHRVDPARAAETGGSGLGLAIARRIARLHGGDLVLFPAKPHGCRFVFSLTIR